MEQLRPTSIEADYDIVSEMELTKQRVSKYLNKRRALLEGVDGADCDSVVSNLLGTYNTLNYLIAAIDTERTLYVKHGGGSPIIIDAKIKFFNYSALESWAVRNRFWAIRTLDVPIEHEKSFKYVGKWADRFAKVKSNSNG